jgi:hypothetical protein
MSFPWTTKLSLDLFRSSVSISGGPRLAPIHFSCKAVQPRGVEGMLTMSTDVEIKDVGHTDVNNAEKTLVPPLKFALVEDLNGDHRRVLDGAVAWLTSAPVSTRVRDKDNVHIERLIPVRVQSLLDHRGRMSLFSIDGDNGEGIRQAKDITLGQAVRGNDWESPGMSQVVQRGQSLDNIRTCNPNLLPANGVRTRSRQHKDRVGIRVSTNSTHGPLMGGPVMATQSVVFTSSAEPSAIAI